MRIAALFGALILCLILSLLETLPRHQRWRVLTRNFKLVGNVLLGILLLYIASICLIQLNEILIGITLLLGGLFILSIGYAEYTGAWAEFRESIRQKRNRR